MTLTQGATTNRTRKTGKRASERHTFASILSSHRDEDSSNLCQTAGAGVWAIVYLFGSCVGAAVAVANYTKSPQTNNPTTPRILNRAKAESLAEAEWILIEKITTRPRPKRRTGCRKKITHNEEEEKTKGEEREENKQSKTRALRVTREAGRVNNRPNSDFLTWLPSTTQETALFLFRRCCGMLTSSLGCVCLVCFHAPSMTSLGASSPPLLRLG